MNRNRFWHENKRGRGRGQFSRGGRGGNRGWSRNRGGFNGPNPNFDGFGGGNRYQKDFHPNTGHWMNRQQKKEKRDTPGKRLSEDLIGVTEYISNHEGFNGIIKSRYSDFQVAEMNEKGEIAKLTSTKPPLRPTEIAVDEDEDLLLDKYNLEILPMETWDKINSLTTATGAEGDENCKVEIDMEGVTKEQRTKIHDAVKKAFGESIVGSTVNVGDKKFMRFIRFRKGVRIDNRVKWVWPGEYTYFIVHKENCDTMDAAVRIAEKLGMHVKPAMIGYAGTKDRRAKTSQWFSIKRMDPSRIATACKYLRDISVGNFTFGDCILKLGMLKGNKFRIALRNVTAEQEVIDAACQHLKDEGFINYYGLQRFGSRVETPTYDIGLKMLQGKFKEAIDAILEPREGPLEEALQAFAQQGPAAAIAYLPWRNHNSTHSECKLITSLAEAPKDFIGALGKLARNIRLLYLHSYQSLVWNRAVSERVRRHGLAPAPGDCVPLANGQIETQESDGEESENEENGDDEGEANTSGTQEVKKEENNDEKAEGGKVEAEAEKKDVKKENQKKKKEMPKVKIPVKILTQEDIDSGKYNLFNIVLPLPGAFIEYPPNMVDYYEELLSKDGLKMDMKHKIKSYNMTGAYRHMVVRPLNVSWQHVRYSDPFADLLLSDRDELDQKQISAILEHGKYKALLLTMILPSSCYATMALRELLKVDTSTDNQALQNNYHKKKHTKDAENKVETEKTDSELNSEEKGQNNKDKETNQEKQLLDESDKMDESNESGEKRKLEGGSEENAKKIKTDE